uniref:hypothetical protein n=1 Tax=Navicula tsukamotoi TaxID=2018706 RepID=UPI002181FD6B|nr:hypothetical protein NDC64_pgp031 [Navicula tsukamotoi]UVG41777.1 hypothetical protein [Navicula tsukamotoi]UXN44514.1 hypothetical chloroplast RF35 [Navicula tsukamotoi]
MSHFTYIKTRFQNLFYLEKALSKLNINYEKQRKIIDGSNSYQTNLVIPQSNGYDVEFSWNEQEYELIADLAFWKQSSPVETFIDKISQQYAGQVIIGESQKIGFQPVKYQQNNDGSQTLVLERWNTDA